MPVQRQEQSTALELLTCCWRRCSIHTDVLWETGKVLRQTKGAQAEEGCSGRGRVPRLQGSAEPTGARRGEKAERVAEEERGKSLHAESWGEMVSNGSLFVGCREGLTLRLGCWVMEGSESHGEDGGPQK